MWYVCDVLCVCCFVVCGCAVSRQYIDVCYCDMFSVVNVYLDHLKFCVVCINGRRYVCCGECYVVSNECDDEPTFCLVHPIVAHCCEVMSYPLSTNFSHQLKIDTASDPDTQLHLPSSSSQQTLRPASTSGNHLTVQCVCGHRLDCCL